MLVREAMTSPVVTTAPSATVRQAIRVLHERDVTALPVVDAEGRLVGIVSEMDLLRGEFEADPRAFARPRTAPSAPAPRHVEDVMTRDVRTARPTTDVAELAEMMVRTRIKSVPVVDARAVVGVISRRDLIAMLARGDARIRDDVVAAISEIAPGGPPWEVSVEDGVVELRGPHDEQAQRIVEVLARTVPGVTRVRVRPAVQP
ncbi:MULTISPECIES: CBS domain-containing protein [Actinomadura]|uniref:BON domain-containing protein n=1 Tax=Actinomadura madurae TaxID=1993 RepID=A0A1I5PET9_9ACTN|nr:CBS domain-containing protein [Actinomadura madurae]SFP32407.1 BON domain-containing protein [Actinomadura madurae]SPT63904.1 Inosine-5'-monophosphate dehydrogenase [Actinomadura madurae]